MSDCCIFDGKLIFTKYKIKLSGFIKYFCGKYTGTGGSLTSGSYCLTFKSIVKLRQGSGKDGQGLVNKRPLMAPNGLKGLSTLA